MRSIMPVRYFFDFTFRSPKRLSPLTIDGNLADWGVHYLVPDLMHLRGSRAFAHVFFSWDDDNLYIGLDVTGKRKPVEVQVRYSKRGRGYGQREIRFPEGSDLHNVAILLHVSNKEGPLEDCSSGVSRHPRALLQI